MFEVTTVTVHGKPTAIGSAGPFTLAASSCVPVFKQACSASDVAGVRPEPA